MNPLDRGHDSRAVANRILQIAWEKGLQLTMMQLVKLVFFAQGWSLALRGEPITRETAQAWKYGPVYPLVYKGVPNAGAQAINSLIKDRATDITYLDNFNDDEEELLDFVVEKYGRMHAFKLSQITHASGSPWAETVEENGHYAPIPTALMKSYFGNFVAA